MTDDERTDLDALLAAALRIAQREIEQVAAFDPFVLVVGSDSRMLSAEIDRSQLARHPEPEELAQAATDQLVGLAASVRATALTVTTRLAKDRSDAIEVRLDHRAGTSLVVIMPFKRPKFGGRTEYGDTTSFRGAHEVWPS